MESYRHGMSFLGGRENPADEQWFNGYSNRNNGTGSYFRPKYDLTHEHSETLCTKRHEMIGLEGLAIRDMAHDRYSPRLDSGCSTAEGSGTEDWTEGDSLRSCATSSDTYEHNNDHTNAVLKEHLFTIGSSAQVIVSHIEGPGKFWCQLTEFIPSLKRMMEKLQSYYVQSRPVPTTGPECVVLHPDTGVWHRGQILKQHPFPNVDVHLVDYGQTIRAKRQDLRPLDSTFAKLKCQAFQCRLVDATCPSKLPPSEWSASAVAEFCCFVQSPPASSLKCTIYGILYDTEGKVVNLVDLVASSLTSLKSQSTSISISLKDQKRSYAPEMAVGSMEKVWITCVKDVHKFYGQLVRHAGEIEKLNEKIRLFCRSQQGGLKCSLPPGAPCFAKYSDGQWYRGRVKMTHPLVLVHFLDYGDIVAVHKPDIIPVPDEASEIMSFPIQAIEFNLSDVPVNTSSDVNRWFDKNATGQHLTAKILEKYPDGKYTVELYDGKLNVNKAVKEKALGTGRETHKVLNNPAVPSASTIGRGKKMSVMGNYAGKQENPSILHSSNKNEMAAYTSVPIPPIPPKSDKMVYKPMEDFGTTEPSSLPARRTNGDTLVSATTSSYKAFHNLPKTEKPVSFKATHSSSEPSSASMPKLCDLPDRHITPDVEMEVYVAHVNSHSSFFVQLAEDEDKIHSLVEKFNSDENQPCNMSDVDVKNLQVGHIVVAMFPDDSSWYRAVIKKVNDSGSILVEFIDFGNEATVESNMVRSLSSFLDTPRLSVHCCLNANGMAGIASDEERTSRLKAMSEGEVKKVTCMFVKQPGSVWEVCFVDPVTTLETSQVILASTPNMDKCNVSETKLAASTPEVPCPPESGQRLFIKLTDLPSRPIKPGVVTEVFISHVNSQDSFFVQLVEDEDQIFTLVEELNADQPSSPSTDLRPLEEGNLISALYAEDESWYRAVVKRVNDDYSLLVEFIDFGNEASVPVSMVNSLKKKFLDPPAFSIHCCLGDVHGLFNSTSKQEIASKLKDYAMGEAKKVNCVFIKKIGNVWEIRLIDSGAMEPSQTSEDSAMTVL